MKLLLAGLFVFVALAAGALAIEALGLQELRGPLLGLLMAVDMTVALALAGWLFREREPTPGLQERLGRLRESVAAGARLQVDPRLDFRCEFVNTHRDLLDGESVVGASARACVAGLPGS